MAASLLGSASSWALARLLKVALKRNLKHVFATEIDVDQLEVGGGALALRELVLSLDWLNAQLAGSDWEATAGFVGSVVLRLPLASLASLSCQVELSDVLLTLRPSAATPAPAWPASAAAAAGPSDGAAWPAAEPGQQDVAVAEGIRIVAAGLEAMLHRLRASISRLAVRLEVPLAAGSGSGGDGGGPTAVHVATLQLDQLDYRPAAEAEEGVGSGTEPDGGGVRVHKSIAFSGLTLQLQPAAATVAGAATLAAEPLPPVLSGKGGGATGALGVEVAWQLDGSCSVAATADLEPLHLQLWPAHLAALASMAVALRQQPAAEAVAAAAARQPPAAMALAAPPHSTLAKVPWGAQSLLDSLLLPDCERVVSESLYSGQEEVDEFFDARSVLGSLQSSFSEQGLAASAHQAHTLAVSVHRAHPSAPAQHWSLYLRAPELSASLLYPAAGPGLCFQPQLVVEVCGLDLEARHGGSGSSNGGPGALEVAFFAQQLEASEYLPCPRGSAAGAGAQLPEEMGCVPEVLPRLARGRALPTASGDYPLPGSRGGLGGDSSSMAHSAVECSMANTVYESTQCDSGVVPRVQVVPVFACGRTATGDGDGGLSLLASLPLPGSGSPSIAAVLPPITLWLAQPLADRLQGLAADVLARFEAAAKVQQQLQQDAGWQPAATAADERRVSIDEILQELHEIQDMGRSPLASSVPGLEACVYAPSVTLIAAVPLPEAAEAAPIRYVALDLAGDERLPPAQIGLVGARDVLTMLEEERVPPLVAVRQHTAPAHAGSCASAVPAFWTVCVTATSGAAYAVGTLAMAGLHHSVLGGLYAETLARATGGRAGSGSSGTFSIDVGWEPVRQPSAPAALNSAWQHVAGTAAGLDVMRLRDECFRGSALNVTIRSPVVSSHLSQPTVEVLLQLSDAVLVQLSPSESTPASAIQTSVLLECSLECELQPAVNTDNLAIVASGVQCFVCSSLGGCQGASMLALSVDAARVEHGERLVLLGASGHSESTLDVLRVSRPAGQPFVAGGRLQVPAEARLRATISGCTLAMDTEGIGMSWLSSMWAFFAPSGNALESSPELASAAAGGAGSGSPDARLHLRRVALQRSALGRQCCGAVPTVLLLGEMSWRAEHGGDGGELLLRDVSLHVAEPALSEGRRAASLAAGLASLDLLDAAGFSQVLSEPCVRVLMRKGTEVEVENTQLMVTLSQRTAGLVQALVSQALQQIPSGNAAGGAGTGGINCWQDDLQASVPLEGGWIEDVASKSLTPPGSPPTLVEHPLAHESSSDKEDEADGRWLAGAGTLELQEAYIAKPEDAAPRPPSATTLLSLPTSWPQPTSMLHLRNLKATVILADTLTTILMPSDSDSDDGSEAGGGAVETAPAASEVQLLLSGLSASLATFGNGDCQLWRLALALKDLEIRDSVQAIGSSRPRAWRRMLGYHASATVPRDPDTSLLSLVVETAHAQGDGVQHSVSLALLPLRLQLDQHSVAFLQAFGEGLGAGAATCQSPPRSVARTPSPVHIECLEVAPFVLTLDYRPRQIDMAALARGHLVEALNLVPFGGVSLSFRHMRVHGMEADATAAAVAAAYLSDIVQHQAHKFVRGVAPIRSLANIGLSTQELLAIPAEALFSRQRQEAGGSRTLLSQLSDRDFQHSLRRGVMNLARAVAIEAMNATATVGGAAALALDSATYRAAREQPAGVREAVRSAGRQVSSALRSGSAVKAVAAAAGAARTLSLGARNALDPDRYAERQLNM